MNPDILLLDEPTNHLDRTSLKWLGSFLRSFKGIVLMVTHDQSLINETSNRIAELSSYSHDLKHFTGGYANYLLEQENEIERLRQQQCFTEK